MMHSDTSSSSDRTLSCSLFAVAQAALGAGIGLILSERLNRPARQIAAIAAISIGAASAIPLVVNELNRKLNSPTSKRGQRQRLQSIRNDAGLHSEAEFFQ